MFDDIFLLLEMICFHRCDANSNNAKGAEIFIFIYSHICSSSQCVPQNYKPPLLLISCSLHENRSTILPFSPFLPWESGPLTSMKLYIYATR